MVYNQKANEFFYFEFGWTWIYNEELLLYYRIYRTAIQHVQ